MGGNALKNTQTRRYERAEYLALRDEILGKLQAHPTFSGRRIRDILAYSDKESFGDMDLLVESDGLKPTVWDDVRALFNPNELVRNGSVSSFDVKGLQVDLILQSSRHYDTAFVYFAYNDLGNLMGRVSYKLGFKYGHDGLFYLVRSESGDIIEEIQLSTDYRETFQFLGYDPDRWEKGFKNLEEIFQFTISSPYFNREYYNLETRSHAARVRDRKRATYRGFLTWLETQTDVPAYPWESERNTQLDRAFAAFPGFKDRLDAAMEKHRLHMAAKNRFNGTLVAELTGLSGEMLGQWIQGFKHQWSDNNAFDQWVFDSSNEQVVSRIQADFAANKVALRERIIPIYNRDNVRDWTGLHGAQLQRFMTTFRQHWIDDEKFQAWLKQQTKETLEEEVRKHAADFKVENTPH